MHFNQSPITMSVYLLMIGIARIVFMTIPAGANLSQTEDSFTNGNGSEISPESSSSSSNNHNNHKDDTDNNHDIHDEDEKEENLISRSSSDRESSLEETTGSLEDVDVMLTSTDVTRADLSLKEEDESQLNVDVNDVHKSVDDNGESDDNNGNTNAVADDGDHDDVNEKKIDPSKQASTEKHDEILVNYAHKNSGATVISSSKALEGTSNVLVGDRDKYAIVPCDNLKNDKLWAIIALPEDILLKSISLANYERYSSSIASFQLFGSTQIPGKEEQQQEDRGVWADLGVYEVTDRSNAEHEFKVRKPAWVRYVKFVFLSHYGVEFYCTVSQLKIHGSTMVQGFHEEYLKEKQNAIIIDYDDDDDDDDIREDDKIELEDVKNEQENDVMGNVDRFDDAKIMYTKDGVQNDNPSKNVGIEDSSGTVSDDDQEKIKAPTPDKVEDERSLKPTDNTARASTSDSTVTAIQNLSPNVAEKVPNDAHQLDPNIAKNNVDVASETSKTPMKTNNLIDDVDASIVDVSPNEPKVDYVPDASSISSDSLDSSATTSSKGTNRGDNLLSKIDEISKEDKVVEVNVGDKDTESNLQHAHPSISNANIDPKTKLNESSKASATIEDEKKILKHAKLVEVNSAGEVKVTPQEIPVSKGSTDSPETGNSQNHQHVQNNDGYIDVNTNIHGAEQSTKPKTQSQLNNNNNINNINSNPKYRKYSACIEKLEYSTFKDTRLNKAMLKQKQKDAKADQAASGSAFPMEPIFKTLSNDIKSMMLNQTIIDQYLVHVHNCYQTIILGMENDFLTFEEDVLKTITRLQERADATVNETIIISSAMTMIGLFVVFLGSCCCARCRRNKKELDDIDLVECDYHHDDNQRSPIPHDEDNNLYNSTARNNLISPGEPDRSAGGPSSSPRPYNGPVFPDDADTIMI